MINTFSLEQISKTGSLVSNLKLRQYKLDLMARFMERKSINPKLTQKEIAKELGKSTSSLQRCRNDINKLSPIQLHQIVLKENRKPQIKTSIDLK